MPLHRRPGPRPRTQPPRGRARDLRETAPSLLRLRLARNLSDHSRPTSGRAFDTQPAPESFHPIGETPQSGAVGGVRTADSVVLDLDDQQAVVALRTDLRPRRRSVLDAVGECLAGEEVGRRLNL